MRLTSEKARASASRRASRPDWLPRQFSSLHVRASGPEIIRRTQRQAQWMSKEGHVSLGFLRRPDRASVERRSERAPLPATTNVLLTIDEGPLSRPITQLDYQQVSAHQDRCSCAVSRSPFPAPVFLRSSYPFEFRACGIPKISRRQVWQLASLNPFEFRACGISHFSIHPKPAEWS